MPFDWMNTRATTKASPARQMWLDEIAERATLLHRMRFSADAATARIQGNLRWEFDASIASTPMPTFYDEVPAIVARIFKKKR